MTTDPVTVPAGDPLASTGPKPIAQPPTRPDRLRKRADFVNARHGAYAAGKFLRVQIAPRSATDMAPARIGCTVTKKNGNAVMRNRIKRRLRAAIHAMDSDKWRHAADYVVISKPEALTAPFDALKADLSKAICKAESRLRTAARTN